MKKQVQLIPAILLAAFTLCISIPTQATASIPKIHLYLLADSNGVQGTELVIDEETVEFIPTFDNSVYRERLDSITSIIPLTYNNYVQTYINVYAHRRRDQVARMMGLSEYYFPLFERVFMEQNIPIEIAHLALVESALNPFAYSKAGASGIWQFMPATGKSYGLKIDQNIDERRDPYKATLAAASYFKNMYRKYGDWLLVIAAYNCGPTNVSRAIRKAGGSKNFWTIRRFLPAETRGYVPAFIAATYIFNYSKEHNINSIPATFSTDNDTVLINQNISFASLADALEMSAEELSILNPAFKRQMISANADDAKAVIIPRVKKPVFASMKSYIFTPQEEIQQEQMALAAANGTSTKVVEEVKIADKKNDSIPSIYMVKRGDNLHLIAQRNNCTVADIKTWNKLPNNFIYSGDLLRIYKKGNKEIAAPKKNTVIAKNTEKIKSVTYHRVQPGDTLWNIAQRYDGLTVEKLKAMNNIKSARYLKAGTLLKISKG